MRSWQSTLPLFIGLIVSALATSVRADDAEPRRPNILFAIADDWGWPHAGAYGDPVVQTPTFDRLARDGVLFEHAYVSSPSCTPSRGAILTGQYHWRLKGAANLWSVFPDAFRTYPHILEEAGYDTGVTGKGWGPGRTESPNRPLVGRRVKNFREFLASHPEDKPFCFWLGSSDPHRPYKAGTGVGRGMDLDAIRLPACFPDSDVVRSDVADYYFEVERFDRLVGDAVKALEEIGELDNTLILMTGDHGMPFPRCKSNVYDSGTRVPLAACWPNRVPAGRVVTDFVSLTDLAPTFFEIAGVPIPEDVTGRSLLPILTSEQSGRIDPARDHVLVGKERHVPSQEAPDMGGYPFRAIRTDRFLFVRNFEPQRWPNGTPNHTKAAIPGTWYGDTDNGPTKTYMINNRDKDETHRRLYELSFGKRPAIELYDLSSDPDQLVNVADHPEFAETRRQLNQRLTDELRETGDPRIIGGGESFDEYPYLGGGPKHPDLQRNRPQRRRQQNQQRQNQRQPK
ncbi:sulfatase [Maioricimonas sp. JC845]|uniref:sulfatase family protein n=1 Tax=Maioricimonas sp. JC845 TaxID=3232138 RepID=UPI003458C397